MSKTTTHSLPSNESIQQKSQQLAARAERVISGQEVISHKETVRDKLTLIRHILVVFKGKHVPYSTIQQLIKDELDLSVSDFTLRKFCQDELGFPKRFQNKTQDKHTSNTSDIQPSENAHCSDEKKINELEIFDNDIDDLMPNEKALTPTFDAKSALSDMSDFD